MVQFRVFFFSVTGGAQTRRRVSEILSKETVINSYHTTYQVPACLGLISLILVEHFRVSRNKESSAALAFSLQDSVYWLYCDFTVNLEVAWKLSARS